MPDLRPQWGSRLPWVQMLYVGAVLVFISLVLSQFVLIINNLLRINYNWLVEAFMVVGQVLFQWIFMWRRPFSKKWRYCVELITVSFIGAALLVPLIGWHWQHGVSIMAALLYFFAVVGVMFVDHWRRVKRLGLPWYMCATWVLCRCLLLVLVVRWPL